MTWKKWWSISIQTLANTPSQDRLSDWAAQSLTEPFHWNPVRGLSVCCVVTQFNQFNLSVCWLSLSVLLQNNGQWLRCSALVVSGAALPLATTFQDWARVMAVWSAGLSALSFRQWVMWPLMVMFAGPTMPWSQMPGETVSIMCRLPVWAFLH